MPRILPALNILYINVSMKEKAVFSEVELFRFLLAVQHNCMPAGSHSFFGLGSLFHIHPFCCHASLYCKSNRVSRH